MGWLLAALAATGIAAVAAWPLGRLLGRRAGYPLAAGPAATTMALGALAPRVLEGEAITWSAQWMPQLEVAWAFRLDGLGLLFGLLVSGVGALVFLWCPGYLAHHEIAAGRFYGLLALFAAAMLALVLTDDLVVLYVAWELTTVSSFLLIAGAGGRDARRAGLRALLVTAAGGLCLLAGALLLHAVIGASRLTDAVDAAAGLGAPGMAAAALLVTAAVTKSAQFPLHAWLPGAMVAPTPVSAYLHAAAMVKAGVYLLLRVSPLLAQSGALRWSVVGVGLATSLVGAAIAFVRVDLKQILAYSTIGQLGFLVALAGVGTGAALAAAALHAVAHAAYKSSLFMVTGAVEEATGSRRIDQLDRVAPSMPLTTAVAGLAAWSMAGLPPMIGFVSKEELLSTFLKVPGRPGLALAVLAAAAAAMTVAYSLRLLVDGFFGPGRGGHRATVPLLAAPALLAAGGLVLGVGVTHLEELVGTAAAAARGRGPEHLDLGLWHGASAPFVAATSATAAGVLAFVVRRRVAAAVGWLPSPPSELLDRAAALVPRAGGLVSVPFLRHSAAVQAAIILAVVPAVGVAAWVVRHGDTGERLADGPPEQWGVVGLLAIASLGVARARGRFAAVAVLAVAGFLVAVLYVQLGAPDLALTQLLVETLTVALIVYAFMRLPREFPPAGVRRGVPAAALAAVVGVAAGAATYVLTGRRPLSGVARRYLELAPDEVGAGNVVNAVLTDFRALDTLGEITVLGVAAVGVAALLGGHR